MSCNLHRHACCVGLIAALLLGSTARLEAQVKPFKMVGAGYVPEGIPVVPYVGKPHWAVGTATELGKHTAKGVVQLLGFTSSSTADFSSAPDCEFVAANGDKLVVTYGVSPPAQAPGHVELYPAPEPGKVIAVWYAEFNPVLSKCTGRFKKLTGGSFFVTAITDSFVLGATDPVAYAWEGEGKLIFRKGKK